MATPHAHRGLIYNYVVFLIVSKSCPPWNCFCPQIVSAHLTHQLNTLYISIYTSSQASIIRIVEVIENFITDYSSILRTYI